MTGKRKRLREKKREREKERERERERERGKFLLLEVVVSCSCNVVASNRSGIVAVGLVADLVFAFVVTDSERNKKQKLIEWEKKGDGVRY